MADSRIAFPESQATSKATEVGKVKDVNLKNRLVSEGTNMHNTDIGNIAVLDANKVYPHMAVGKGPVQD